jgi:hypothetical protein
MESSRKLTAEVGLAFRKQIPFEWSEYLVTVVAVVGGYLSIEFAGKAR